MFFGSGFFLTGSGQLEVYAVNTHSCLWVYMRDEKSRNPSVICVNVDITQLGPILPITIATRASVIQSGSEDFTIELSRTLKRRQKLNTQLCLCMHTVCLTCFLS